MGPFFVLCFNADKNNRLCRLGQALASSHRICLVDPLANCNRLGRIQQKEVVIVNLKSDAKKQNKEEDKDKNKTVARTANIFFVKKTS